MQETYFRQQEAYLLQPEVRQSPQTVAQLLADEFIEFGSSGQIFNKAEIISGLQQETPCQRDLTAFKAKFLAPDIVLTTYHITRHSASGQEVTCSLRSSIWKLIEGRWQMVFHQGTLIPKTEKLNLPKFKKPIQ